MTLTVEMWPIDKLTPYGRNPRQISDVAIAKVAGSLNEFRFRQPIVVDTKGVIVAGHTRWLAARKLGMTEVPVHVATDLTPTQIKAYRMADNRTGQESAWDGDLLKLELEDLKQLDFDLPVIGFDPSELEDLFGGNFDVDELDGMPSLPDGDKEPFQQMTFTLHDDQAEQVKAAIDAAKALGPFDSPNENSNGNALARICELFLVQHGDR